MTRAKPLSQRGQEILEKWQRNMEMPYKPDPEFEQFLNEEAKEIDRILDGLGGVDNGRLGKSPILGYL
jgi:hypothetical protein